MHSLSNNETLIFNSEILNPDLLLTTPTSVINVFFKIHCTRDTIRNHFTLTPVFMKNTGESLSIPFYFKMAPVNFQYLVPGNNSTNEEFIADFIQIKYEEPNIPVELNNGEIEFQIEALYLTNEERASYERDGLSVITKGGLSNT